MLWTLLLLSLWLPQAATPQPTRILMKDGTSYLLKEPPQFKGGRIVFTTVDGSVLSVKQDDVQSIGMAPKPTSTPSYDIEDSRALGAITRDERNRAGKTAEIAPKPTHKPAATPKKRARTPTPTPKPKT
ncbi:MAG TPA: hypothetical protein VJA66_03965 [Thermoanaerobaculia bacterium]